MMFIHPVAWATDPLQSVEQAQIALYQQAAPAVVFLANTSGFGSGFFVQPDGLILTNAHVVAGSDTVDVVLFDGRRLSGTVVERGSADIDLALVRVPIQGATTLRLANSAQLQVGAWVAALGHGEGGGWTFTTGMVSNIYPVGEQRPIFQTQIPVNPGSSGGPVLNRQGEVVGIVTAGIRDASLVNFAIKSEVAYQSLHNLTAGALNIRAPAGVPIFVDGRMIGQGPSISLTLAPGDHVLLAIINGRKVEQVVRLPGPTEVVLE